MHRIFACLVLLLLASALPAQWKADRIATTKGGPANTLAYYAGYIYAGCGATLAVYDARSGKKPPYQRIFTAHLGSRINDLVVREYNLYVAQHHGGISRWNIRRPNALEQTGQFKLQGAGHPAYDVSVVGDTTIVAFEDRVVVLRESHAPGNGFEFLYSFGEMGARGGRIVAGDVRGDWYACATGWENTYYRTAIFLYNWRTGKRVHFYPRKFGNARDIAWDPKHQLLHVAGGQHADTKEGLYFAVMVGDRGGLREVYADTIPKGDAVRLRKRDGQIWLATSGGRAGKCKAGQFRIYEAEDSVTVRRVAYLNAKNSTDIVFGREGYHVASGEEGILHIPFSSLSPVACRYAPPPKITLTGAGCTSADRFGDRLVLTAPGFGLDIYDLSKPRKPMPLYHLDQIQSAYKVVFSEDGKYLYILQRGQGGNFLEIRETESWRQVGRVYGPWGYEEMVRYGKRLYLLREGGKGFDVLDVSKPRQPEKEESVLMPVTDLQVDDNGRLLVTNENKVRIFDVRKGALKELLTHSEWKAGFGEIVGVGEDLVVYQPSKGLVRYSIEKVGSDWALQAQRTTKAPHPNPDKMLSSEKGILLGYDDYGVFVLHPEKLTRQNHLGTGFGFLDREGEALRDLVLCKNLLLVVEFFGQVTIVETESE